MQPTARQGGQRTRGRYVRVVFGPEVFGQRYGGISRYVLELHRRLPALGVTSTILAGVHQNAYLPGTARVRGFHVPEQLQKERLRPARERVNDAFASAYVRAGRTTAIYHQTYYGGKTGIRHRGPHVVTAYDLVHAKFPEHFPPDDPTTGQQREAFSRADLIIAISHTTKADLQDFFGIEGARIAVTHLGVTPPIPAAAHGSGVTGPYLLYVGQRYGYKNWERFVRAYAATGLSAHLRLVCTGVPFTADEKRLITDLRLRRAVLHVRADDATLDRLYRQAVAFVYPSLYEGFGLPPLEAMARDCPVMASNAGSVPEVLGDAAVYADPYDLDSMAKALTEVVRPERRDELVGAGRALADTYSWERTTEETVAAYRSLF
jgi:glycosyltransferase involved in cell wall biosynthesis